MKLIVPANVYSEIWHIENCLFLVTENNNNNIMLTDEDITLNEDQLLDNLDDTNGDVDLEV